MDNLKKLRIEKGISQQKLAKAINSNQQNIHRYENGFYEPDITTLKILADFFNTSIDYLVGATSNKHKYTQPEECGLNQEETVFLEKFRELTAKQRKSVLIFLNALADAN